jgi:hypothetical protein
VEQETPLVQHHPKVALEGILLIQALVALSEVAVVAVLRQQDRSEY